ncbi:MAG: carboxypeptidase-like regulatory domain-containing protein, partial [Prevotella sp.]|nr:carboxypeptidase-like regulatory domain-containing protein [Prevotella sp.]
MNENGLLRRALWTMLFMLFSVGIYAQDITVRGKVTDPTGDPVIGATIKTQGTNLGTITNANGEFSLQVPANSQITVSYVGFAPQTLTAAREMNIVLAEDATGLSEVVVTALGLKREQKALGYAMTELKGEELDANLINPVQALQGKVAGVEVTSSDGGMFGASKILIRGASTLNKNNQPIYVIDGVILDNSIVENDADWASGAQNYGNELKNLNPDDFETVSVLKGAAATALYGSRG